MERTGLRTARRRLPTLRPWSSGPVLGAGLGREIIRHYPHLSERMAGLALGADLPLESLVSYVESREGLDSGVWQPTRVLASAGGDALLFREFDPVSPVGSPWQIRRSQPEVGFASVEVTVPWLASAIAGINEEGLAAAIVTHGSGGAPSDAALAVLLVQECLQQFDSLDGCLDWCGKRPSAASARILFADASGEVARIDMGRDTRDVERSKQGDLVEGSDPRSFFVSSHSASSGEARAANAQKNSVVRLVPRERQLVWMEAGSGEVVFVAQPATA